jgi:hypothetical protein
MERDVAASNVLTDPKSTPSERKITTRRGSAVDVATPELSAAAW